MVNKLMFFGSNLLFLSRTNRVVHRNVVSIAWKSKKEPLKVEKIGGKYLMSLIPGMGASRHSIQALTEVLMCSGAPLVWEVLKGDFKDDSDFENLVTSIRRNGIAIKGNMNPFDSDDLSTNNKFNMSKNMLMRRRLDLHTFITQIKSFEGLKSKMKIHKNLDVIVVRQNTEGDYALLEHSPVENKVVEHLRVITRNNSARLAETAFMYATRKNRRRVQCLHRKDAMPMSEGIFVEGFLSVAEKYPYIEHKVICIKDAFQNFLNDPQYLDVAVTNGLDGVILTNFLYGMLGSPHLVAGLNIGDNILVVEPGSRERSSLESPNPTSYFLCGSALLDFIGCTDDALVIRESLEEVFMTCGILTKDLGGKFTVQEFTQEVIKRIRKKRPRIQCSFDKPPTIPKKNRL